MSLQEIREYKNRLSAVQKVYSEKSAKLKLLKVELEKKKTVIQSLGLEGIEGLEVSIKKLSNVKEKLLAIIEKGLTNAERIFGI